MKKQRLVGKLMFILGELFKLPLDFNQEYVLEIGIKRNLGMNDAYNSWIRILANHHGYSIPEMKRALKHESGLYEDYEDNGKFIREYVSTADLPKEKMMEFLNDIETHAIAEGVILPKKEFKFFDI